MQITAVSKARADGAEQAESYTIRVSGDDRSVEFKLSNRSGDGGTVQMDSPAARQQAHALLTVTDKDGSLAELVIDVRGTSMNKATNSQ